MLTGDYAEIPKRMELGLCQVIATEGKRVHVLTETGDVLTLHERSINRVPGPLDIKRAANEIRAATLAKMAARTNETAVRHRGHHMIRDFAPTRDKGVWRSLD